MKFSKVVPIGFLAIISVTLVNAAISKVTVNELISTTNSAMHSYEVRTSLQELEEVLVDIQLGERGFIMSRKEDFLEPYNRAIFQIESKFEKARLLLSSSPEQSKRLDELEVLSQKEINILDGNIDQIRAGRNPSSENLAEGKRGMELMRNQIKTMLASERSLLEARQQAAKHADSLFNITSIGGMILGASIGLLIISFMVRKVVKPIDEIARVISSSSGEIAATVEQQERLASEQAISVNQTTTTMDELGASSQLAAEQAVKAATGAQQALTLAETGNLTLACTLEGMSELKAKVEAIAEQISLLSQQADQIAKINKLVSELANQTNMLALNAAVEAVRAGEHGKGFGVVASEIRKLADRSKHSAEQINALVGDIQSAINATVTVTTEGTQTVEVGVQTTQRTADAFAGVVNAINSIVDSTQQISLTAKQQAIAIGQVVEAMNHLNESAVQNASGITQTKVGTQKLKATILQLRTVV